MTCKLLKSTSTAILLSGVFANVAIADSLVGYDKLSIVAAHRDSNVQAAIFYPLGRKTYKSQIGKNAVFLGETAYVGAGVADGQYPLILVSHGSGGNIDNLAWLANGLTSKGAIVVGVNHPGSTSGDSSPRRSIIHGTRPMDLSAALDSLLEDPTFGQHIDPAKIYTLGFSLGGLSAMEFAGASVNLSAYQSYCDTYGDAASDCEYYGKGGVDLMALDPAEFNTNHGDARISKAVVIDPALGYAMTDESLSAIDMPVQIINLGAREGRAVAIDASPQGSGLAAKLKNVQYDEIAPANHFSFLGLCGPNAAEILKEEGEDPICENADGEDRAQTHVKLIETIASFLFSAN